jgi:hypothetical protein
MNKYIFVLYCVVNSIFLSGQNKIVNIVPAIDTIFTPKLTGSFFIEPKQFIGEQYYNNEWIEGDILLASGNEIKNELLKYNGVYDELIWLNQKNFSAFKVDKYLVKEFRIRNKMNEIACFKHFYTPIAENDSSESFFAEVIVEDKLSLYIQHKIAVKSPDYVVVNNIRKKYETLLYTPIYYLKLNNGEFLKIKQPGKKYFLKLFPEQQKSIKRIIAAEHLNIKHQEDFIQLVKLMNKQNIFENQ